MKYGTWLFISLLCLVFYLYGFISTFGFVLFHTTGGVNTPNSYMFFKWTKVSAAIVCTFLVFGCKETSNGKPDTILKIGFIFILIGEVILTVLALKIPGIIWFILVHLVFIVRNAQGIGNLEKKNIPKIIMVLIPILGFIAVIFLVVFGDDFYESEESTYIAIYTVTEILVFWSAMSSYFIGFYPKLNTVIQSLGWFFFLCTDCFVALTMTTKDPIKKAYLDSFVWVFYVPSLLGFTLSTFKYSRKNCEDSKCV